MTKARDFQDCLTTASGERRRFQRLAIPVQTELRIQDSQAPIRVETSDISLGGCYVEMALTLAVGIPLNILLWLGHEKLVVDGRVATCHPQFGNGIEFINLTNESQQKLEQFLKGAFSAA